VDESHASVADDNPLRSRLNRETYALFHLSQKPPQMVATLHEYDEKRGPVVNIDVIRCRYNGFMEHTGTLACLLPDGRHRTRRGQAR
jgi:hypothetical protein